MMTQEEIGIIVRSLSRDAGYKLEEVEYGCPGGTEFNATDIAADLGTRLDMLADMLLGDEILVGDEVTNYPLTPKLLPDWVYRVFV